MPPKFNPSQVVDVFVCVTGCEVGEASSLIPKIGPLDFSLKKIGEDIVKETAKDWKGLPISCTINGKDLQQEIASGNVEVPLEGG